MSCLTRFQNDIAAEPNRSCICPHS